MNDRLDNSARKSSGAPPFDAAAWLEGLLTLNPWARGLKIDEKDTKFVAARREACIARFEQAREKWNTWAQEMFGERGKLVKASRWAVEKNVRGALEGQNDESRAWLATAVTDFSRFEFVLPAFADRTKPKTEETEKTGQAAYQPIRTLNVDGDKIDFTGFVFPGYACFREARFAGDTWFGHWFGEEEFLLYEHFVGKAPPYGRAEFPGAQFFENASFSGAQFAGRANFGKVEFHADASFDEAQFAGRANFDKAQFAGSAHFDEAQFAASAHFDEAKFDGHAGFVQAQFAEGAVFRKAQFEQDAKFWEARFAGSNTSFAAALFAGGALFNEVEFTDDAWFGSAQFTDGASFRGARFLGDTVFRKARFVNDTEFREARFAGRAEFDEVKFAGDAEFGQATFEGYTNFRETQFAGAADFSAIEGKRAFSLADARFAQLPDFIQAHFEEAPRLDNLRLGACLSNRIRINSATLL